MFKFLGSLAVVFALVAPVFATHCNERIVQRVVSHDYGYQNVQALILVPHNKIVERIVNVGYDSQPVIVEKVIERVQDYPVVEKVVVQKQVVRNRPAQRVVERSVQRIVNRPRVQVRQRVVQREVVVQKQVVQERIIQRNVQRIRGY